ncbi:MAG: SNF2-related protein [Vicinamibacterales bacterium]
MGSKRRDDAKARRREQAKRTDRHRRQTADKCAHLLYEAESALNAGDMEQARRLLEQILRIRPNHEIANQYLADLHFKAQQFELGLVHYDRLSQIPDWPPVIHNATVACFRTGRFDQGRTLADLVLKRTVHQAQFERIYSMARVLRTECAKAVTRAAATARRRARAASTIEASRHTESNDGAATGAGDSEPAVPSQAAPATPRRSAPETADPQARSLPPFPRLTVPEIPIAFEVDRGEFPTELRSTDVVPAADVQLRWRYAELRLQKGFDELVALGAVRDVTHFRYQLDSVRRILRDFRGRVLLADEVGLGKTIEACLALKEYWMRGLVRRALILTPPSLVGQWVDELRSRFDLAPVTPDSPGFHRDADESWARAPLVVASLALVRQPAYRHRLRALDYDLVIVDEAHALKRRTSAAWQLVNDLKTRFLLLLSATPVGNDLSELYNLILLLRPGLLHTEAQFRREYGQTSALEHAGRREKLRTLLREVMLRNTRAHIDLKLPRRLAATQVVLPGPAEAEMLARLTAVIRERYATASAADRWRLTTLQMQAGSSPAALRSGLGERAARLGAGADHLDDFAPVAAALSEVGVSAKATALVELARRSDEKKIVFTRFRATLDELERVLVQAGFRVAVFHGGLTTLEKEAAITAFQGDAEMLLSSEIGGEGRNLQFCRTVINYDLPWNPMAIEQRVGRVHRIGQSREVYVFNFCLAGSIEERILRLLHDKINLFELIAGEIEMILGHLDDDQDFASVVMEVWAKSHSTGEADHAFEELSATILHAKAQYQQTRELDRALFSQDYEV